MLKSSHPWCAVCLLLLQLLDELYHEDKGFNHNYTVLLSEQPPSLDVQHVLSTHPAARKLTYLQGSPFRPTVSFYVDQSTIRIHACAAAHVFC
jgi:hypothetical protein